MKDEEEELKDLTIHALKELGEIAETLIKNEAWTLEKRIGGFVWPVYQTYARTG